MRENSKQKRRKRRKAASGVVAQICCLHRFALSIKFKRILFLVALAFANQICDIQSTPIQLRHNQQQLGSPTAEFTSPPPTPTLAAATQATTIQQLAGSRQLAANIQRGQLEAKEEQAQASTPPAPRQRFRHRPDPVVTLTEGNTILLRCEVDHQTGDTQWLKDGQFVFYSNRTPAHNLSSERRNIVGSVEKGEHNLELVNARLEDSGLYECQVQPTTDETDDNLIAPVQVIVRPQQLEPQPQNNKQRVSIGAAAADPISLTKLPRGAASSTASLTSSSSSSAAAQFLTHQQQSLQSTSSSSLNGQQQQQQQQPILVALKQSWPYFFLGLAGLLMLANIYLIYSLFKRHQKNQRANSKCPEGSLGSSTVASSGSPLVSSSQSTESTSAATTTTTNASATSQQQQQQQLEQFQLHQQQLQIQLQQQLQQLRPQISANCDYDYDMQQQQQHNHHNNHHHHEHQIRIQRPDSSLRI